MREIRTSGSEGGGAGTTGPPYPYRQSDPSGLKPTSRRTRGEGCDVETRPGLQEETPDGDNLLRRGRKPARRVGFLASPIPCSRIPGR